MENIVIPAGQLFLTEKKVIDQKVAIHDGDSWKYKKKIIAKYRPNLADLPNTQLARNLPVKYWMGGFFDPFSPSFNDDCVRQLCVCKSGWIADEGEGLF